MASDRMAARETPPRASSWTCPSSTWIGWHAAWREAVFTLYLAEEMIEPEVVDGLRPGPRRNFQVLDPLDSLAEFTRHIPPKGAHLIRYYGWHSNKARGLRRKAADALFFPKALSAR